MRKNLLLSLALVVCMNLVFATAALAQTFAKDVAKYRETAVKNASNKAVVSSYSIQGGAATPGKVTVDMKKGESVIVSFADASNYTKQDYFVLNNMAFQSGGKKVPFTPTSFTTSGNTMYKQVKKRVPITYNKKTMPNALRGELNASMIVTAPRDQSLTFEYMYQGSGKATFQVIKVADTKAIEDLTAKYPQEMADYASFADTDPVALLYATNLSVEKRLVSGMIGKIQEKKQLTAELGKIDKLKGTVAQVEAYLNLFAQAKQVFDIQQQLKWFKVESVELAFADLKKIKGYDVATNQKRLDELKALAKAGFNDLYSGKQESVDKAQKVLDLKREILFANPNMNFDEILVGRYNIGLKARQANPSHMGMPRSNWTNQTSAPKSGFDAEIGKLTNFKSGKVEYKTLYKPNSSTSVPDIRLHWDANRVLFSAVPDKDHHWQVFEMTLNDGKVTQVTNGSPEDLDYFDSAYLPNDKLAVTSNVGGQGVPCVSGSEQVGNICLFDPKTKEMRRLTFDQDANWDPIIMHNGKVMYSRWEYTDLMHYYSRFVMSMNPDGTEQKALFGSGMLFPNSTFDIQPLPDHPSRFIGVVSGHHGTIRSGRLFIYDPAISRTTVAGMVHEIPFKDRELDPVIKDRLVENVWPTFVKPFPVDNNHFLVTGQMEKGGLWGIYLVDMYDNVTLICEYEGEGLIHATPIRKTKRQPVIPDKTDQDSKEATVFIQDIYEGEGLVGVPRGTVTQLRIHTYEYAYNKTPSNNYAMGVQSGWDMKTCLGVVDLEADGSVMFKIPANTPIAIQPLDSEGRAITWMRSWFTAMPGEVVSCVGCHEDQNMIPKPVSTIAMKSPVRTLTEPEGGIRPITYQREIQPILDRACISCHGEGKKLDFRGGLYHKQGFSKSHLNLHPYVHRQGSEAAMRVLHPYEYHATVSPLVQILKNGHYGVELTDKEWKAIYMWIDYNVVDMGVFKVNDSKLFPNQYQRRIDINKKYANGIYADWRKLLDDYDAWVATQPKAEPVKPNFKAPEFKEVKVKGFPAKVKKGQTMTVDLGNGTSIEFIKVHAGEFVMGENKKNSNAAPAVKAKVEKDFWMSTKELTNAQYRALIPDHDSRFYDQQWKDHVVEGYPANGDDQVAIRISWENATKFAELLSGKSGKNVQLPTETQWEWAARGGSDSDWWFANGASYGDFTKKENLADKQMTKMAVKGVDPKPLRTTDPMYELCNFMIKDEKYDDGNMLTAAPGSYEANSFGLYDMLGNVSEWTRSSYALHTDKKAADENIKIVKGGAWNTHPKDARVATRKYFYKWQAPYNVGLRLVIEE
ncbi:MAG: SUMF1/EgtB/PvdO family nonheme iron enzyme [Rikenellaceae bacterium]